MVDESDFIEESLFNKTIMNLMLVENVVLIMITTDNDKQTKFREIFSEENMRYVGGKAFNRIIIQSSCDECAKNNKSEACPHNKALRPDWQSDARLALVKHMLKHDEDSYRREALGISDSGSARVFVPQYVDRIFTNPPYHLGVNVPYLFVAIDPNGGRQKDTGKPSISDFAVVSGFRTPEYAWVITGAENVDVSEPSHYEPIVARHVNRLANLPQFQRALVVVEVESNLGMEAMHIADLLRSDKSLDRRLYIMDQGRGSRPGMPTTSSTKWSMILHARSLMAQDFIQLSSDFYSSSDPEKIKKQLQEQIKNFSQFVRKASHPGLQPHVYFDGKLRDGVKDDLCMAFMLWLYLSEKLLTHPDYLHVRAARRV